MRNFGVNDLSEPLVMTQSSSTLRMSRRYQDMRSSHTYGKSRRDVPKYAGSIEEKGWSKIVGACEVACNKYYKYICCIDKSGSAELSEAINSMYRYYVPRCKICYAYLADMQGDLFS
jgi:hypothetical protein